MRHGIQTCREPIDPNSIYMRNLYSTVFWGPFENEKAVIEAVNILDAVDPYWDYNPFCIIYGSNPLPEDFVFGFRFVDEDMKERIYSGRKPGKK